MALSVGIDLLVSLSSLNSPNVWQPSFLIPFVLVVLINLVFCLGAYGLWQLHSWSWWITTTWCAFGVIQVITYSYYYSKLPEGTNIAWLFILGIALVYLFRREMGELFNIQASRPLSAVGISTVGGLLAAFPFILRFLY